MDSTAARECTLTVRVSKRYIYFEIETRTPDRRRLQKLPPGWEMQWISKTREIKKRAFERRRQASFVRARVKGAWEIFIRESFAGRCGLFFQARLLYVGDRGGTLLSENARREFRNTHGWLPRRSRV